jgi:hypothetical protein
METIKDNKIKIKPNYSCIYLDAKGKQYIYFKICVTIKKGMKIVKSVSTLYDAIIYFNSIVKDYNLYEKYKPIEIKDDVNFIQDLKKEQEELTTTYNIYKKLKLNK